jgi:DNA ligase (NAD+)
VTEHARYFVAEEIKDYSTVELRAEVILTGNHHRELGYKTRRNGTAGMLNADATSACRYLTVLYYELITDSEGLPRTEIGRIYRMTEMGLTVAPYVSATDYTGDQLVTLLAGWKAAYAFDMDGVVITPNDSMREDAMRPDNKIAFKVNEEATLCNVVDIEWNVGRTGRVTPVVIIDATEIGGVTVERATGFNAEFVTENGISEGAVIGIYRSGDVIPYIDFVLEPEYSPYLVECPSCNSILELTGVDLVCGNRNCAEQNVQIVEYFLRTLGCENVTAVTLRKLDVQSVKQAYDLDEFEIATMEGFGIKRAEVIVSEIRKTLRTTPDRLLASFGISGVGKTASQNILKVHDFDDLWNLDEYDFISIDGIGQTLSDNLMKELPSRKGMYEYLKSEGLQWNSTTNTLRGKVFCLTGNGTVKRDILIKMIEQNGGYVKGMSKNVDVLVTADPNSTSGKAKKARQYGTDVIGYDDLLGMLEY